MENKVKKTRKPRAASRKLTPETMEIITKVLEGIASEEGWIEETALYEAGQVVAALALGYGIKQATAKLEIGKPRGTSVLASTGAVQVDGSFTPEDLDLARSGDVACLQKCEEGCIIFIAGSIAADTDTSHCDTEHLRIFFPPCFKAKYGREMEDNETDRRAAKDLVDEYIVKTCQILSENSEALELTASMLLAKETLGPDDIKEIKKLITMRTAGEAAEHATT
jgi:hypothetical protein